MPNNANARRAGSVLPAATVSSNKLVRGQVLTAKLANVGSPTEAPGSTAAPVTPGTGTVTSVTAGTGLSASPNPITGAGTISLPNVGTAATTGDATHVAQITTDAQGRITAATPIAITYPSTNWLVPGGGAKFARLAKNSTTNGDTGWYGPDWFNAKDYGAVGDGSTDDTTAINAAITAAIATGGVVYFPSGKYKITSALSASLSSGKNVAFIGQGYATTSIYQTTASANGLTVTLPGVSTWCEVANLSFVTPDATTGGTALTVTYGNTNINSTSQYPGPWIHHISIGQHTPGASGGWTAGLLCINCWLAKIETLFGFGNDLTWASGSGAGSGAFISCLSAVNYSIRDIHTHFWGNGIKLAPVSVSTAGQTQIAQGVLMSDINMVECLEGIHLYTNNAHDLYDMVAISNFQIDNGNVSEAAHRCIYVEYGSNIFLSNGLALQNNGSAIIELNNNSGVWMDNVRMQPSVNNPSTALAISGTGNGGEVDNCGFNNLPITIAAGSNFWTINKTAGSTITNSGTNNILGDTKDYPVVITPTATATYSFSVSISAVGLAAAPFSAWADVLTSLPNDYKCVYDYNNVGNTATTAFFLLSRAGGGSLAASAIRLCVQVPAQGT